MKGKKMSEITLKWRGHSCYKVSCEGYSILFDPYEDGKVPGCGPVRETVNEVLCSHEHGDHNFRGAATIEDNGAKNPFTITTVTCPHDDAGGSKRGMNTIHILDNGSLRVVHFGDIGCPLTEEQRAAIGKADAVMVPVGGYLTMEPDGICELMEQLSPRVIIPMHYRSESFGFPVIGTLDAYLEKAKGNVCRYDTNTLVLTEDTPEQIAVLSYLG